LMSSALVSCSHEFVVRIERPNVHVPRECTENPTRFGSCCSPPPEFERAVGVIVVNWYRPALPLSCAVGARERPAGLTHEADGSSTRAAYAPASRPPNGPIGTPLTLGSTTFCGGVSWVAGCWASADPATTPAARATRRVENAARIS